MSADPGPVHVLPDIGIETEELLDLPLRVWAELGRAALPASVVVGMSEGAIVDLDRAAEDPADLYVNGRHFGTGRLILVEGEWALRIDSLDPEFAPAEALADHAAGSAGDGVNGHPSTPGQDSAAAAD